MTASNATSEKMLKKPQVFASPDTAQMTPFKPSFNWFPGEHRVPGGTFPLPPLSAELCTKLPPPSCFEGPYVILDQLVKAITSADLVPKVVTNNGDVNGKKLIVQ